MIWIDSSFAIEWLAGTERARRVRLPDEPLGILPAQYMEVLVFFLRRREQDPLQIVRAVEALELRQAEKADLQEGARLYFTARARNKKSKASLADALLAAVVGARRDRLAAFDDDFAELGLHEHDGFWRS